jgi:hypothetical protein
MRDAEVELEAELENLMVLLSESELESEAERFSPPATHGPLFDLACGNCADGQCVPCPDGFCAACPVQHGACRAVLGDAIVEAIKLARGAAAKLESAISVPPGSRNNEQKETARLFTAFFCHDPSLFIPWAHGPSGASIAVRFRAVAKELDGGRKIHFVCRPTTDPCGDVDTCCDKDTFAFAMRGNHINLFLCPQFWDDNQQRQRGLPAVDNRAGTIIHEMLHMLFGEGPESGHGKIRGILDADPKRANAHCYNAFVLRVNGFGRDQVSNDGCGSCQAMAHEFEY